MGIYQNHIQDCTCVAIGCDQFGKELHTEKGNRRLCNNHAKTLIFESDVKTRPKSPPLTRGLSARRSKQEVKEEQVAPNDMPPLGKVPPHVEVNRWSNPSDSVSTGSAHSLFQGKMKEIGGRKSETQRVHKSPVRAKKNDESSRKSSSSVASDDMGDRQHSVSRSKARTVKVGNKRRKIHRAASNSSLSFDSSGSRSGSISSSEPSNSSPSSNRSNGVSNSSKSPSRGRGRKHRSRKKEKSRHKPSFQSLLPKGLCHGKIRSTRHTVRGRDELGARLQPRGKYEDIVDHLGAVRDREEKKAGCFCQTDQFVVVALRGFGLRKTILGTGTYGAELEQVLRRQGRSEKDRLCNKKLKIVITNRIARAASCGRFGFRPGEGGEYISIATADCSPPGWSEIQRICVGRRKD